MYKKSIYTIVAIFGIGVLIFSACNKDEMPKQSETKGIITQFSVSIDMVESTIVDFNQKFTQHKQGFKSSGDLLLGEALWLSEAGVNYEFRSEKDYVKDIESATFVTSIPVDLNESNEYTVTESDVYAVYENMLLFASEQLGNDEVIIVSDVEIGAIENSVVELTMTVVTGTRQTNPYVINSSDYWRAANDLGKCDGSQIGRDAAWRINQIINATQLASYWTDIETYIFVGEGDLWDGDPNECLSPSSMSTILNSAQGIIAYLQPTGKHRIDVKYVDDIYVGEQHWLHIFEEIRYGIPGVINP